ncbi:hypothetical protein [Streptomyces sp. NPDC018711]|uniref:hypothetical protein n=1 Tax=Streptomyces sp. NPDC018711 TaxID=3365052 RepID=UPI0037B97DF6
MSITTGQTRSSGVGAQTGAAHAPRAVVPRGGRPGPGKGQGPGGLHRLWRRTVAAAESFRRRYWDTVPARLRLLCLTVLLLTASCAALLLVAALGASRAWDSATGRRAPRTVSAAGLNLALSAVLVLLQWYLARRFHRVLSPALLAATACGLTALLLGLHLLTATSGRLETARRDAFDSVVALSRARAVAYDANADESRYLLDPFRRAAYEQSFLAKSQQLYGVEGADLSSYGAKLAETWARYRADHEGQVFTGEFRRELDNITSTGERANGRRPSGRSRPTPHTSATTARSGHWWPSTRSGRRSPSASAGNRTSPTPTSAPG